MTDAERKAMEWLDNRLKIAVQDPYMSLDVARTLKDMLARPVLPEEPSIEALIHMDNAIAGPTQYDNMRAAYRALRAHLSAPKTKEVEYWLVEYANKPSERWLP